MTMTPFPPTTGSPVPTDARRVPPVSHRRAGESGRPVTIGGRIALAVLGVLLAAGFGLAAVLEPDPRGYGTHERFGLPPCSVQLWWGRPCPSCGSTTSFAHFVRGQWGRAIKSNAAAFGLAVTALLAIPWSLTSACLGRLWRVQDPEWTALILVALYCGVSLVDWAIKLWLGRGG